MDLAKAIKALFACDLCGGVFVASYVLDQGDGVHYCKKCSESLSNQDNQ